MGSIRREGPAELVDGHESKVLQRDAMDDAAQGWNIETRPYRPRPEDQALDNLGSGQSTCLLAGNRVLMADGSSRPIETVRVGDEVMTMSGPARIWQCETTTLGLTRKVIELRGLGDECLVLSDDHPLWVSRPGAAGGPRKEWWGTYNLHHTMYEMRHTDGSDFRELPIPLHFDLPEQVAHVSGWLHVRPVFHHMDPATRLYHLVVDAGFSFIAEGFGVYSHCLFEQGPRAPWAGLKRDAAADRFIGALAAG